MCCGTECCVRKLTHFLHKFPYNSWHHFFFLQYVLCSMYCLHWTIRRVVFANNGHLSINLGTNDLIRLLLCLFGSFAFHLSLIMCTLYDVHPLKHGQSYKLTGIVWLFTILFASLLINYVQNLLVLLVTIFFAHLIDKHLSSFAKLHIS